MKQSMKIGSLVLPAAAVLAWVGPGCVARTRTVYVERRGGPVVVEPAPPPGAIIVVEPPPPDRYEVYPDPRPGYIWIRGHYVHEGRGYAWVPGYYERLPRSGAVWEPGHWDRVRGGYIWVEGRWR